MSIIDALILGVVQGLTEFLPVSSSGHLALGKHLLGLTTHGLMFEVAVHVATALAVMLAYRRRLRGLVDALPSALSPAAWKNFLRFQPAASGACDQPAADPVSGYRHRALQALRVSCLKTMWRSAFNSTTMVCLMLIATGVVLMLSRFAPSGSKKGLTWSRVLLIGVAQACALLPGISRSGMTITAALLLGLSPGLAAEFSFLLALPAIFGATVVEIASQFAVAPPDFPGTMALIAGLGSAFFSGLLAIFFLLKVLSKGRFDRFAWYCWAVASLGLILL